jgi:hypothetical protein
VERQPKVREALFELGDKPVRRLLMFETHHEVVGVAHDHDIAVCLPIPPLLDPQVEHVVQVDIGQQWADAPTLHRSLLTSGSLAVLQHARAEPFLNRSHDAPCSGSQTARGPTRPCPNGRVGVTFRYLDGVGIPFFDPFAAQYPAHTSPYQRFTPALTSDGA